MIKKLIYLLGVVVLIAGFLSYSPAVQAAATGVTLTASGATTVNVGEIKVIPTLTITDVTGAQIVDTNTLDIHINAATNAVWDITDTTAVITPSNPAHTFSATVSYTNTKTLRLTVSGTFAAAENATVSGLSYIGYTAVSGAQPLNFDVTGFDAGKAGAASTNIDVAVDAQSVLTTLTAVSVSAVVGTQTSYAVNFTVPDGGVIPADGKIVITFPAGFTVATDAISGAAGINGNFTIALATPVVTLTRAGGGPTNSIAGAKSLTLNKITNHATANSNYTVTVRTNTSADALLATANTAAFAVNPAAINNLACLGSGAPGSVYISWTVPVGATGGYSDSAKYSTSAITNDGQFNGATDIAAAAQWGNGTIGQSIGSMLVTGLDPLSTYFFNVKAKGAGTSISAISTPVSMTCTSGGAASSNTSQTSSSPASSIISPASGSTSKAEAAVTITGTSSDNGVSSIKKVEVSTDGGTTWAEAASVASNNSYGFSWTYNWAMPAEGPHTIKSRATNWVGVVETPGAGISLTVLSKSGIIYTGTSTPEQVVSQITSASSVAEIQAVIITLQTQLLDLLQQLLAMLTAQLQH